MVQTGLPGIPGEFVRRCESYCKAPLFNQYFRDSEVSSYVWLKMMEECGVELMLNTFAGDPIMEGKTIKGLLMENKSGTQAVLAKVVIDATGDVDVAARSGASVSNACGFGAGLYFAMNSVDMERYNKERRAVQPSEDDIGWAKGKRNARRKM